MAKYQLRRPDIDLAADARHRHIPGTSYHWKHGYIPLDARTATLFHKKAAAKRLVAEGKISVHEPAHVKAINSRGTYATKPLSIVPSTPKPKAPEPVAPKAPAAPAGVKPISPSLAKELARHENYDSNYYGSPRGKFQAQGIAEGHLEVIRENKTLDSGRVVYSDRVHLTEKGKAHLDAHRGGLRKPVAGTKPGAAPRSPYDALLTPKSGDILMDPELPGSNYGDRRYRFSGSQWIKEYPTTRNGQPTGDWRKLSNISPEALRSDIKRGSVTIAGVEPGQIENEIASRRAGYEAKSLKAAQKKFGTGKVHGFTAISGHEAARRSVAPQLAGLGVTRSDAVDIMTRDYVPEPGMVHLVHDNGTQVIIDAATAKKMDTEAVHRLAGVAHDVTSNYVHDTAAGHETKHGPVAFHVDQWYSEGGKNKGWSYTRRGQRKTVLGYVNRGDTQNVHLNPATAIKNTLPLTSAEAERTGEHFISGHRDLPTMAHGTMIHELGHIADNRTDHTGLTAKWGQHPEARDFHSDVFGGPLSGKTPGAGYARSDAAEGYAEAFTHAVATRHATELARNKRRVENEQKKAKRAAHDQAAAKYDAKYGFFSRVSTP